MTLDTGTSDAAIASHDHPESALEHRRPLWESMIVAYLLVLGIEATLAVVFQLPVRVRAFRNAEWSWDQTLFLCKCLTALVTFGSGMFLYAKPKAVRAVVVVVAIAFITQAVLDARDTNLHRMWSQQRWLGPPLFMIVLTAASTGLQAVLAFAFAVRAPRLKRPEVLLYAGTLLVTGASGLVLGAEHLARTWKHVPSPWSISLSVSLVMMYVVFVCAGVFALIRPLRIVTVAWVVSMAMIVTLSVAILGVVLTHVFVQMDTWFRLEALSGGLSVLAMCFIYVGFAYSVRRLVMDSESACTVCGYDLTGNTSGVCPECGSAIETTVAGSEKQDQ